MSRRPYIHSPYTLCTTIMLAGSGRIRLLQQALLSYTKTSHSSVHKLLVVVDKEELTHSVYQCVNSAIHARANQGEPSNIYFLPFDGLAGHLGALRNAATRVARAHHDPEYLHFVDDDVYFRDGWIDDFLFSMYQHDRVGIIGGDRHPYHKPLGCVDKADGFEQTDAVAGYSMFMRTDTYSRLGGFPSEGKGIGASEDWAICQKARRSGMVVGYSTARPVLHCGLTNSNGQPATGADQILANKPTDEDVKGVIYE